MKKIQQIISIFLCAIQMIIMNNVGAYSDGKYESIEDRHKTISKNWIVLPILTMPVLAYIFWPKGLPDINVESWEGVANIWFRIYSSYENKQCAEAYEVLAEMNKCLSYSKNVNISDKLNEAAEYYKLSGEEYYKLIKNNQDINSAKSSEMMAKSKECEAYLDSNKWNEAVEAWEKVALTKPSYSAYAQAKKEECKFRAGNSSEEQICQLWEQVKNDKALRDSFSPICHRAYVSLVDANVCAYKLSAGLENWEHVSDMWRNAADCDFRVIQHFRLGEGSWYWGFAAEAIMKSKDRNHCYY